jgi:hypothetical protein
MTLYAGERTMDGVVVTCDGALLDPREDVAKISRVGLEWGFDGPPAHQLALALLCDHLNDPRQAKRLAPLLARELTSRLPNDWTLRDETLARLVSRLDRGPESP